MDFQIFAKLPLGFAAALALMPVSALAQSDYPNRPVEMSVLFGGTANTIAQLLAEGMSQNMGNPVVAVARTGGGGAIGYSHVQASRPDGYSMVFNSNSINTVHHLGMLPFGYDAFEPVAQISVEVPVMAVHSNSNWTDLAQMAEEVLAEGMRLNVGISGRGSFTHIASAALFEALGIGDNINYVSYGDGNAPIELLAGRIDAAVQWPGQVASYIDSGDLVVVGALGSNPIHSLPDAQSAQDQGYDIDIAMWRGLAVPTGTSPEIIAQLEAAAQATVESEAFERASQNIGFEPAFLPADEFGAVIERDDTFYAGLLGQLEMGQ